MRLIPIFALSVCLLLIAGCGSYHAGASGYQWDTVYRKDVQTIHVPIFTNKSFRTGVEFRLTEAIIKSIEAQTPYRIAPADQADTILEGEITDIRLRTISSDPHVAVPQEQLYRVRVNFVWKDLRDGRILVQRRRFEQDAPFYPTLGEGQFVGSQLNVERLGLAIVQELQADW